MNRGFLQKAQLLLSAFAPLLLVSGCTVLLDRGKQCAGDADCKQFSPSSMCVAGACQEAPPTSAVSDASSPWSCLGQVTAAAASLAGQVSVRFGFFDLATRRPVANVMARPCAKLDAPCANPIGPFASPDDAGNISVSVPAGFDGYIEIADGSANNANGYVPSLFFMNPLPFADMNYGTMPVFTASMIGQLATAQGNTIDPAAGFIFSGARDCRGTPAAGISWEPDRITVDTRRFYYVDGLPSETAVATDATGYGGLINMPIGTVRLFAKQVATGQSIGEATIFVRASQISFVFLQPTP